MRPLASHMHGHTAAHLCSQPGDGLVQEGACGELEGPLKVRPKPQAVKGDAGLLELTLWAGHAGR